MARVTGIGGVFFKSSDPKALGQWYRDHLGVPYKEGEGAAFSWESDPKVDEGMTAFSIFSAVSELFVTAGVLWIIRRNWTRQPFPLGLFLAVALFEALVNVLYMANRASQAAIGHEALSTGMKRRLIFARALLNQPHVLLLDEPTTGLDPQARHLVWDEVRHLKRQGVTIILTTHYMDEAEILCDRILIVDRGKIIEQGTPMQLIKKHVGNEVLELDNDEKLLPLLKESFPGARIERLGERIQVFTDQPHGVFEDFLHEQKLQNVMIRNANIEDVFLKLTGRGLRED
jgi:hypothetical protein